MKTAMELALARIELMKDINPDINWEMFKNDCIEKEKEQIIKAVEDTRGNIVPKMFIGENLSGQEYYNQTYNQNK